MNNQSPLVPQGSLLDQKNKGRKRVEIAVFVVLAIHGIGLLALLMQGCQKPPESGASADTNGTATASTPAFVPPTNPTPATPAPAPTNVVSTPATPTNIPATPATPVDSGAAVAPVAGAATDYTIAQGDTLGALAKKFNVKVKAIEDANPGIDPTKLKIGQKIHIPAPPAAAPTATPTAGAATDATAAAGEQMYTVKSGDTLGAIAKATGVHIKDLRSANSLKTDRITVGQKLKIPPKSTTAPASDSTTQGAGGGAACAPPSR